jgi:hypothetical protein
VVDGHRLDGPQLVVSQDRVGTGEGADQLRGALGGVGHPPTVPDGGDSVVERPSTGACDALGVANVILLLVVVVVIGFVVVTIQRRRRGLVAERGTSIGADLGSMNDQPRVRVSAVTTVGPDRVRLVLTSVIDDDAAAPPVADDELLVYLREEEVGFDTLEDWKRRQNLVASVMLPGQELVRLRSIDDLQPLTLRRVSAE